MTQLTDRKTQTYRYKDTPFLVDVSEFIDKNGEKEYEAYLWHENYGVKSLVFGTHAYFYRDINGFVENIEAILLDYIESYANEYMD